MSGAQGDAGPARFSYIRNRARQESSDAGLVVKASARSASALKTVSSVMTSLSGMAKATSPGFKSAVATVTSKGRPSRTTSWRATFWGGAPEA